MYGRAYREESAYAEQIPYQAIAPLQRMAYVRADDVRLTRR